MTLIFRFRSLCLFHINIITCHRRNIIGLPFDHLPGRNRHHLRFQSPKRLQHEVAGTTPHQHDTPAVHDSRMPSSADDVVATKQALRKKIRAQLKTMTSGDIHSQSIAVWDRLKELPAYQQARSIGLFLSMPAGEIDTDAALTHAVETGKTIYVPQVGTNFEKADMELRKVFLKNRDPEAPGDALFHHQWPRNKWGIPEPPEEMPVVLAEPGDIDVLVVPGLAFDSAGNRLGQGKGYYDRFLTRMFADCDKKPPLLIAVGLSGQLVDEGVVPVNEFDFPVDWILIPEVAIQVKKS